jgi:acyl carrier protein
MSSKKINKNKKINFLENFFIKKEGKQILKKIKKINLIKEGYLDSMDVVNLASLIQRHFKIKINLSKESVLKSFENFSSIIKLIK